MADSSPASGQELLLRVMVNGERNTAKKLGNFERLQKWQEMKFFPVARKEWTHAWKIFSKRYDLESFLRIQSGKPNKRQEVEGFVLALLKYASSPAEVLKKQAAVIHNAASEGDVKFFQNIGRALNAGQRAQNSQSFLAFNILRYWFAGLLWLMNDAAGVRALRVYTDSHITKDAYRKAWKRLKLKGYKHRMTSPPVRQYDSQTRSYNYADSWTYLEPICPRDLGAFPNFRVHNVKGHKDNRRAENRENNCSGHSITGERC